MESSGECSSICSSTDHNEEHLKAVDKFILQSRYLEHVKSKLSSEVQLHKQMHGAMGCDHGGRSAHQPKAKAIIGFKSNLQKKIEKDLAGEVVDLMKMLQFKVDGKARFK